MSNDNSTKMTELSTPPVMRSSEYKKRLASLTSKVDELPPMGLYVDQINRLVTELVEFKDLSLVVDNKCASNLRFISACFLSLEQRALDLLDIAEKTNNYNNNIGCIA